MIKNEKPSLSFAQNPALSVTGDMTTPAMQSLQDAVFAATADIVRAARENMPGLDLHICEDLPTKYKHLDKMSLARQSVLKVSIELNLLTGRSELFLRDVDKIPVTRDGWANFIVLASIVNKKIVYATLLRPGSMFTTNVCRGNQVQIDWPLIQVIR